MIDIRYTDNELTDCSWYNRDAIVGEGVDYMIRYFTGREQPNYPMPAIPLAVMWPQAWDKEIDWHNACHFIIIRKTEWNDEWFEGEFVTEYRV